MSKGKILALMMALVLLALPLSATAQSITTEEITLTISWWGGDSRHEATQAAVEKFMELYPNITVETTFGAWSGWSEATGLKLATDTGEDVMQINWNWISEFGGDGTVFANLYDYTDVLDVSQFPEAALEASEINGMLQAIPVATTARTMYWNKNTFDAAGIDIPTTWDELIAAGATFAEVLGDDYYPLCLTEYDRAIFMVYYLESMYGKVWISDGVLNYSKEEIIEGFEMIAMLEEEHVIPTVQMIDEYSADPMDTSDRWIEGYWAGNYNWNTSFAPMRDALPEDQQDGFVTTTMFEGLPYKGGFNKISMLFAVPASSEHPVEAAALINFLLNEEAGVLAMASERGVPASAAGFEIASANDILDEMTIEATNNALNAGWNTFALDSTFENSALKSDPEGMYYQVFSGLSYGDLTTDEAADMLIEAINELLAE